MHLYLYKIKRKDFMFMLFVITCLVYYAWNYTVLESLLQVRQLKYIASFLYIVTLLNMKKKARQWIFIAIIVISFGINFIETKGNANLLLLACIALTSDTDRIKVSINALWCIKVIALITTILAALIGFIDNKVVYKNKSVFSFGFATHNGLILALFIILSLYFLKKEKIEPYYIRNKELFFWTSIIIAVAFLTKSKTGSIVCILFLILLLLYRWFKINRLLETTAFLSFPILFLLSYFMPRYLNNPIVMKIDQLLNSRLSLSANVIANSYIGLFYGEIIFPPGGTYQFLDSGYLTLLYSGGTVISVLFILGYIILIAKAKKEKKYILLMVCICFSIYAFAENILCTFASNYLPIFM